MRGVPTEVEKQLEQLEVSHTHTHTYNVYHFKNEMVNCFSICLLQTVLLHLIN